MSTLELPISEFCQTGSGTTPSRQEMDKYFGGKIPWVKSGELRETEIINTNECVTEDALKNTSLKLIPSGALLVAMYGATVGRVGKLGIDATTNQAICHIIPDPMKADNQYMFYALQYKALELISKGVGGAQPNINQATIKNTKIYLPKNIGEQKRIAAILDQADSLRRLRRQSIEKLNTLSQSIFYDMFGDVKTNSHGWDKVKLGDICGVGSSKRVFVSEFVENGIPFYRGTEVGKLAEGRDIALDLFISEDHYNKLVNHTGKPKIGDLLLPSICHDGRIWQVNNENPFYFKDGRVLWIKNDLLKINSGYLTSFLKVLFLTSYSSVASGTTFSELKIINLKNLSVLFPPIELQNEYEKKVKAINMLLDTHKKSLEQLETLFLSLQQKAFKGTLS